MRARTPKRSSRWLAAGVLLGGLALGYPGCSNRPTYVCEALDDCELLRGSVDDCIDHIEIATDSEELKEDEVGHCLDCIVEHSCKDVQSVCLEGVCHEVLVVIEKELEAMGGAAGAAGQGGAP